MIGQSTLRKAAAISRYMLLLESRLARLEKHVVVDSFVVPGRDVTWVHVTNCNHAFDGEKNWRTAVVMLELSCRRDSW